MKNHRSVMFAYTRKLTVTIFFLIAWISIFDLSPSSIYLHNNLSEGMRWKGIDDLVALHRRLFRRWNVLLLLANTKWLIQVDGIDLGDRRLSRKIA